MRRLVHFLKFVVFVYSCLILLAACSSSPKKFDSEIPRPDIQGLKEIKIEEPISIRLKSQVGRSEVVSYLFQSSSRSFEGQELRHQKDESMEFVAKAEGLSEDKEKNQFTQRITIIKKDGAADLHDFAMPELGETLDITSNGLGQIFQAGDYPANSIFYVPSVSVPEHPVEVGDTWIMQASWLSLQEMVPYQLDMVSILKSVLQCGQDRCAEIEVQGDVGFQGPLAQSMKFNSHWKGKIILALDAGSVVWSRLQSEEYLESTNVHREVSSCMEAVSLGASHFSGMRCGN